MTEPSQQSQHVERWIWFLDVLFGAIAAIAIDRYEPIVRNAWATGIGTFSLSVFVAICVGSFFVYDVAVYHSLAKKFPYKITVIGFARFYLDLVMAFILFLLLTDAFNAYPNWFTILITITSWHVAAAIWHLFAQYEAQSMGNFRIAVLPHVVFIGIYWLASFLPYILGLRIFGFNEVTMSSPILVILSATIAIASVWRWTQVIHKLV